VIGMLPKYVWPAVASAALVAQAVFPVWSGDCRPGCCVAEVPGCCTSCPAETAKPPCHCRLDARQDQAVSVERGASSGRDSLGRGVVVDATSMAAPHALGVSREYVAASLAVPIRPVRILRGVWRN
jgi:hypothetical protein